MFNDMEGQIACKTCEPSTVSTPNRAECERCNYLSYTPDHEKCYQCTRISDDPPCYSIKTNTSRNLVDKKSSIVSKIVFRWSITIISLKFSMCVCVCVCVCMCVYCTVVISED